ncbi:hypothetical protein H7J08_20875 [Mycobacterium frederiksbergense]|uniref:hypothetical protein n=1 Tax=Mycolicibacterium frederiksbergense TaxID=117567 RepID=UPI0021F3085F|nr:hypothetical protein [Mycolicibacterium frederiksbergense]MCV7047102.1 hypothetical protein [Mycolicibacterium frederiksbergense]
MTSAMPLFALPLIGAAFLPNGQFAIWSILASISTLALSVDFGGPAYLAAHLDPRNRNRPFIAATAMSCGGTAVVGLVSICAWIPFSHTDAGGSFTLLAGAGAIAAITCGSALRSVVQLQAQVALFDQRFTLRNAILLTHGGTALVVVLIVLPMERTAWALPIAWVAAGLAGVLVGSAAFRKSKILPRQDWAVEKTAVASGGTYAWARTVAVVFRGFLMQADRWIVGAIGGPAVLAAYEVAWRVAALPRFLAENLTFIIGLDAARVRASTPTELTERVKYCIRFSLVIVISGALASSVFYAVLPAIEGIETAWWAFALLLITHSAIAVMAPISFVGNGIGIPKIDLPYLALSVTISACATFLAFLNHNVYFFVAGTTMALVLGNAWFWRYGLRVISKSATLSSSGGTL